MEEKRISPLKAIRLKCLECSCGSAHEVKLCPVEKCALYPYRFGKNPNRAGIVHSGSFGAKNSVPAKDLETKSLPEGTYIPQDLITKKEA